MKVSDVCVVTITSDGGFTTQAFLARVLEFEEDKNNNWAIHTVQLIGENFKRQFDTDKTVVYYSRIVDADKQTLAEKLIEKNWGGRKAYKDFKEVKERILQCSS